LYPQPVAADDRFIPVGALTNQSEGLVLVFSPMYGTCEHFLQEWTEECKYYGSCCNDPMRLREKLKSGTFRCTTIDTTSDFKSKFGVGFF